MTRGMGETRGWERDSKYGATGTKTSWVIELKLPLGEVISFPHEIISICDLLILLNLRATDAWPLVQNGCHAPTTVTVVIDNDSRLQGSAEHSGKEGIRNKTQRSEEYRISCFQYFSFTSSLIAILYDLAGLFNSSTARNNKKFACGSFWLWRDALISPEDRGEVPHTKHLWSNRNQDSVSEN